MKRVRVDQRAGLLMGGVVFATFVALGAAVALPAGDPELAADARDLSPLEERGMTVFRSEGCWYCHTQYLRNTAGDVALGEPLGPDAYAGASPAMLGHERIGPDLLTVGFTDAAGVIAYLREPGKDGRRTAMPSYAYLGEDDLRALAAYLLSLR
ncbi:MAG: cbb3-type cytochrome c oxidase subunit II [Actinomycetota bacterium]